MITTVYKFHLMHGSPGIDMPRGAQVLCAREQNGELYLWALVDPEEPTEERHFDVFGTGHVIPPLLEGGRRFVDTVLMHEGSLVLHVFERTR